MASSILGIVSLATVITAGVYCTKADVEVSQISDYSSDADLTDARNHLSIASAICWVIVGLIIIAIIIYFTEGININIFSGSLSTLGTLLLLALAFTIGVYAALAATSIRNSSKYTSGGSAESAYYDSITAAVLGIGLFGIVVISFIYKLYREHKSTTPTETPKTAEKKTPKTAEKETPKTEEKKTAEKETPKAAEKKTEEKKR